MFAISADPIRPPDMEDSGAGGFVSFEGKVRNQNQGEPVLRLEYEAYAQLAETEGQLILDEGVLAFGLKEAQAIHRVGILEIGETALWVGVAAAHREQAFRACSFIVDELKRRVPIWKKEHYASGTTEWIGCHDAPPEKEYFRRQTILSEVGDRGQEKLATASVLVVGAGGLGCAALPYLAGAGIGAIGIAEGDVVELSNLHRQVLFTAADRGLEKGPLAAAYLKRLNPFIKVQIHERLSAVNAVAVIEKYDIVVDGTDNFEAKFLLNDICVELGKPLVQASLHQFEGQLLVVDPGSDGGCMRCIWPEAPYDGCVGTCAESGILGAVAGVFGTLQANEVLKIILGMDAVLNGAMLTLDLRTYESRQILRKKRPECSSCGTGKREVPVDVDIATALALNLPAFDIREPEEWDVIPGFEPYHRVPLSSPANLHEQASKERAVLLICEHGIRSAQAARWLRESGIEAFSLLGGADSVRRAQK